MKNDYFLRTLKQHDGLKWYNTAGVVEEEPLVVYQHKKKKKKTEPTQKKIIIVVTRRRFMEINKHYLYRTLGPKIVKLNSTF